MHCSSRTETELMFYNAHLTCAAQSSPGGADRRRRTLVTIMHSSAVPPRLTAPHHPCCRGFVNIQLSRPAYTYPQTCRVCNPPVDILSRLLFALCRCVIACCPALFYVLKEVNSTHSLSQSLSPLSAFKYGITKCWKTMPIGVKKYCAIYQILPLAMPKKVILRSFRWCCKVPFACFSKPLNISF